MNNLPDFKEEQKQWDINEAKSSLTQWQAMKLLVGNNLLAATIEIAGIRQGVCNNSRLIPVIEHNIREIEKFLNGEPNEWE